MTKKRTPTSNEKRLEQLENPPPVLTKSDFVRRYARGEFGNRAPTWETLEEFEQSGYKGLMHIRNRVAGGATFYNVEPGDVRAVWNKAIRAGQLTVGGSYFSAMAPTEKTLIQGEVQQSERHLELTYAFDPYPMRQALALATKHLHGMNVMWMLHTFLCDNSYEWLQHLLDKYPFHVIEFSTYPTDWGTLPNYNTVFWEVRRY